MYRSRPTVQRFIYVCSNFELTTNFHSNIFCDRQRCVYRKMNVFCQFHYSSNQQQPALVSLLISRELGLVFHPNVRYIHVSCSSFAAPGYQPIYRVCSHLFLFQDKKLKHFSPDINACWLQFIDFCWQFFFLSFSCFHLCFVRWIDGITRDLDSRSFVLSIYRMLRSIVVYNLFFCSNR